MNTQMPARTSHRETPGPALLAAMPEATNESIRRLPPANRERRSRRTARRQSHRGIARVSFGL